MMSDWHDDDAFWADTQPVLFSQDRLQQAPAEVEQILDRVSVPPGAAVLDMCCGTGRHALELARRGYRVTGVDRTARYLAIARSKAAEQGLSIELVEADMRRFRRDDTFDLAVNLLTSFGYFTDVADDRRVAENLFASLKPGGRLVMDLMGKEVLARIFRRYDWHEEPDGTLLLEERTIKDAWSWLDVRWIIIKGEQRCEHRFALRLYCGSELRGLLADVGFGPISVYGSLKGTPYDHEADRLAVFARKPPCS